MASSKIKPAAAVAYPVQVAPAQPHRVEESRGVFAGPFQPRLQVLVDSGPLVALFNARDHWHARVLQWLKDNPLAALVSTWPVATEVCALLSRRIHNEAALDFLRWMQRGGVALDVPDASALADVLRISERFADLPFDLADASIAEAASRLRLKHVLSVDANFDVYRGLQGRPLVNLLRS